MLHVLCCLLEGGTTTCKLAAISQGLKTPQATVHCFNAGGGTNTVPVFLGTHSTRST